MSGGGAETERQREGECETERISSRLTAVGTDPEVGLECTNCEIMT